MSKNLEKGKNPILSFTAALILVSLIGFLLIAGRSLLIPLVIAVFIWHLLNTLNNGMQRIPLIGHRLPNWFSMILSLCVAAILVKILIDIITNNVNEVINASPRYQENLTNIFNAMDQRYHIKALANLDSFLQDLSVQRILVNIYGVFTTITSSAVLILLYVVFLFVEQHFFKQKLQALFPHIEHRELVQNISNHIVRDTQTYLGLKTLLSLITAIASWVIMKSVGLDFAEFWALLIFFLNFIPNIGAIIATAFPMLLALIQFQSWVPFFIITSGIVTVEFVIGNMVEPRFLGKSLNLSPLVILIALALWGAIWGILGMFLSVPITVMMMIIFAHFDATRPIAILLSQDGYIHKAYERL
ncbi:AI-2E family transporter [Legionella jordanis]|uniref:Transporter, permease n=1 Tax=Legionella jordanis TaxID=456 RepID=A0A0W0V9L4_9GAMM|nr:AI-2E family transporter [Legionella jordanis]KTD16778.1 transporter, permease [Legionella jordanis]RMX03694.1 AI-2E family transporter [Legionella jordanis]RMX22244.1 AI-2E family transporter [Legionella jordanis]VEH11754.1 transporter, permease [Legionella jordanis]HAT8712936.1 AI-2E family transporter [Legionella jordanis]